jgi:capsular polysaccharide biosynthesis protein
VDLWDLAKLMWRRWYVMAPMLLLTIGATTWAVATLKPDYTSTGTIILTPPPDKTPLSTAELSSTNTWVEQGEDVMAGAVAISVQTKATREEIASHGLPDSYEVIAESRSNILTVTATAPTPELAQQTVQRVQRQIADEVVQMQAPFHPKVGRAIGTLVLDKGDTIEVVTSKIKRAAVVIIGVGVLLTAAVTVLADLWLRRRAARKPREAQESTVDEPAEPAAEKAANGIPVEFTKAEKKVELDDDATVIIPLGTAPWAGKKPKKEEPEKSAKK